MIKKCLKSYFYRQTYIIFILVLLTGISDYWRSNNPQTTISIQYTFHGHFLLQLQ
jgi:hypothetical protein